MDIHSFFRAVQDRELCRTAIVGQQQQRTTTDLSHGLSEPEPDSAMILILPSNRLSKFNLYLADRVT